MITDRVGVICDFENRLSLDDVSKEHNDLHAIQDNFQGHLAALNVACDKDMFPCLVVEDNVMFR